MLETMQSAPRTTVYRVEPRESPTCSAGDTSNFCVPQGTWDLSTFRLQFNATVTGIANSCFLPRNMASLIDMLVVYVDDVEVQSISRYNQLARILADYDSTHNNTDVLDNAEYISDTLASATYNVSAQPCCISRFHGLLGSGATIRGAIRVQVFWAPNTVLLRNAASSTYALAGMHAVIKIGDPDLVTKRVVFDQWTSEQQRNQSYNQQTHLTVQSDDIEFAIATFLPGDYDTAVSTTATGGSSRFFVHGTATPATSYGISCDFKANQVALSAGSIGYDFAPEGCADIFGGGRSISYPAVLTRNGTVAVRSLAEVLAYQWCAGVPIGLRGSDKTLTVSFNTIGSVVATNFSLLYVKTNNNNNNNTPRHCHPSG